MIASRPATEADAFFIRDSWVASYRDSDSAGFIQVEDWYPIMLPQVAKAMLRPDVKATMAYETNDPNPETNVYGFIVADTVERPAYVYYVFVKANYRRQGVAGFLFRSIGVDPSKPFEYACSTRLAYLLRQKVPLAKWRPSYGRFPKAERRRR